MLVTCSALQTARAQRCSSVVASVSGRQVALHEGARDRLRAAERVVGCRGTRIKHTAGARREVQVPLVVAARAELGVPRVALQAARDGLPAQRCCLGHHLREPRRGCSASHCHAHKALSVEIATTAVVPARPSAPQCLQRPPHTPQQPRCHLLLHVLPCRAHISRFCDKMLCRW